MKFSWFMLVDFALYMLYSMTLTKPKPEEPPPVLEIPDETIGRTIPVLFGRRLIKSPIMAWWGDLKILKIKVNSRGKK